MVLDPQLLTKVSKCVVVKLFTIVRDKDPRDHESINDALPNKATGILLESIVGS